MKKIISKQFLNEKQDEDVCINKELRNFDKLVGILRYLPKKLRKVVR